MTSNPITPTATANPERTAFLGCGDMARHHAREMLKEKSASIPVVFEPSPAAYARMVTVFEELDAPAPVNAPDLDTLLSDHAGELDSIFICSPHSFHHDQTVGCLEAGLDVLLEKPMVTSAEEAESLIRTRDETGRLLVVAFPGSLSPEIREAARIVSSPESGKLLGISATVWQNWGPNTANTWRQVPEMSGGGFLFDTGAHMLNTVVDIAGEDFVEVAAFFRPSPVPVEYSGVIIGRLASGAQVTMHGCGEAIESCDSDVRVFTENRILKTGVWGRYLEVEQRDIPGLVEFKSEEPAGVWNQFLAVRSGKLANPCPPEVGLRMARLWDAIRISADRNGEPVSL